MARSPNFMRQGSVRVTVQVESMGVRLGTVLEDLIEWLEEEQLDWKVARGGPQGDLLVTATFEPPMLDNGNISAAAWTMNTLDRAFSALSSDLRWFSTVKVQVTSHMPESAGTPDEEEGKDHGGD